MDQFASFIEFLISLPELLVSLAQSLFVFLLSALPIIGAPLREAFEQFLNGGLGWY